MNNLHCKICLKTGNEKLKSVELNPETSKGRRIFILMCDKCKNVLFKESLVCKFCEIKTSEKYTLNHKHETISQCICDTCVQKIRNIYGFQTQTQYFEEYDDDD